MKSCVVVVYDSSAKSHFFLPSFLPGTLSLSLSLLIHLEAEAKATPSSSSPSSRSLYIYQKESKMDDCEKSGEDDILLPQTHEPQSSTLMLLSNHDHNNNDILITSAPQDHVSVSEAAPPLPISSHHPIHQYNNAWTDIQLAQANESGTPEERVDFMKELENFHRDKALDFKPPKFYGEQLNCLKLWRAVIRLGGYEVVTASKLWRQVGESFHPPKTCTTVSWTFRIFYEKALLEYEKHKTLIGELQLPVGSLSQSTNIEKETSSYQAPGSGRARRDAAARAMQGWHAQRLLGHGEVAEPIIKDKNLSSTPKREKNLKNIGLVKHKMPSNTEHAGREADFESDKQVNSTIMDIGPPADWVKINVRETNDCFEVYALVPGLLREEVRVQSDPAGRLVITGQPEHIDNPWGITPFKKVVSLPARIDPLQTSAVVSLHGRLLVRVPFEQGSM